MRPRTRAGKALYRAQEHLDYGAYDAPRFMQGYDFTNWIEAIAAIEREAAESERERLTRLIEQRDHDYALHLEDVSPSDTWTEAMLEVYSATVGGVLDLLRPPNGDEQ